MKEIKEQTADILDQINTLQKDFNENKAWRSHSRDVFIKKLENFCINLNDMQEKLDEVSTKLKNKKSDIHSKLDFEKHMSELQNTCLVLERNLGYEKQRRFNEKDVMNQVEPTHYSMPEMYDYLEQKSRSVLLNTSYLMQRLTVYLNKEVSDKFEYETDSQVLQNMLKLKEQELESLQNKYSDLRKDMVLGKSKATSYVDFENAFNENMLKLDSTVNRTTKSLDLYKKHLDYMHESYQDLKEEIKNMNNFYSNFVSTSMELVTLLKKERDYAMKLAEEMITESKELRFLASTKNTEKKN